MTLWFVENLFCLLSFLFLGVFGRHESDIVDCLNISNKRQYLRFFISLIPCVPFLIP